MNNVKVTKADLIEEILGLLILTGTSPAMHKLMAGSLHLMPYAELRVYANSLTEDINLARQLPPLDDIEGEI
jgi:hypothetical protein